MQNHRRKLYSYLPNVIFTVLLSFALTAFIILYLVKTMALSPKTYTDAMYKSAVDVTAFDEINAYFERQSAYTGVNADVLKNSIAQKDVSASMFAYVDSTFEYMSGKTSKLPEFEFDFTALEENVHNDYLRWAAENNVQYTDELAGYESRTIASAKSVILNKLDIMLLSYLNKDGGISTTIRNNYSNLGKIMYGALGVCILLLAVIVLINRKHIRNLFYWTSVAFLTGGVILVLPTAILKGTRYFDSLVLANDAIYSALTQSLYAITNEVFKGGIILIVTAALLMFIHYAMLKGMFKFRYKK